MPVSARFRVGAFAVVRDEADCVLLGHRRDCDFWCLPGGGMEAGESPWEAAVREVRGETGLMVEIERLVGVYSWPDEREHIFSFTAHLTSGRLTISDETRDVRFFAPDELPTNTFAEHAERIHDALASDAAPVIAVPRALSAAIEQRQR
jgi:8-oxo-dGTP diphosphatase